MLYCSYITLVNCDNTQFLIKLKDFIDFRLIFSYHVVIKSFDNRSALLTYLSVRLYNSVRLSNGEKHIDIRGQT